jgi:hypothetical protein
VLYFHVQETRQQVRRIKMRTVEYAWVKGGNWYVGKKGTKEVMAKDLVEDGVISGRAALEKALGKPFDLISARSVVKFIKSRGWGWKKIVTEEVITLEDID